MAPSAAPGGEAHGGSTRQGGAAARKRLRVLATNDFHGALQPSRPGFAAGREVGGAAALAAYFARERAAVDAPTVLIDGGDVMQGTPISNLTEGRSTVDYYNGVGYTAAALGNHEFDWGIEALKRRVEEADFAWLGANILVKGTDTLPSWVEPATMVTLPGCGAGAPACDSVRVGIIGIATEQTPTTTKPSNVASLTFADEAEAMERWVPRLRAQGADFVIVTAHSGAFCTATNPRWTAAGEIVDVAGRLNAPAGPHRLGAHAQPGEHGGERHPHRAGEHRRQPLLDRGPGARLARQRGGAGGGPADHLRGPVAPDPGGRGSSSRGTRRRSGRG